MRVITISREFGSGGRELGKRLADHMGYDYYDREIITAIAKSSQLQEDYVENMLEKSPWQTMSITYGNTFFYPNSVQDLQVKLLREQTEIIKKIGEHGKDCVIVGRNADFILQRKNPFKLFVCAQMNAKIQRCMQRAKSGENLTRREIERQIHRIDKARANTREIISSSSWGDYKSYNLIVNTTDWDIKSIVPHLAELTSSWFDRL